MSANQVALSYLLASVLFILSLRGLSHPLTARRGNLFGMIGMALAVLTTLAITRRLDLALGALAVGAVIGVIVSRRVQMTQMPELVAAMHSLVGLAAVLIACAVINDPAAFGVELSDPERQPPRALRRHLHRRNHVFGLDHRVRQAGGPGSTAASSRARPSSSRGSTSSTSCLPWSWSRPA